MKKSLAIIILVCILLISCTSDKEAKIIANLDKVFNESAGYEGIFEMKVLSENQETRYLMREKFFQDNKISLEILEPSDSQGITIEYKDNKIFLNHASINQSISLKTVKDFDKGILLVNFFENLDLVKSIKEEEIDGKDYYLIEYRPRELNKYNHKGLIYFSKKRLEPFMMEVLDKNGNIRLMIKYEDFKYIKSS
jgi:outer membrane lipoprotein-sorting protein